MALLANAPTQAETLLHSPERPAANIGLHFNARKAEYMCFNQTGDISILNGSTLKLVNKFTYLGSLSHQPRQTSTRDLQRHGQLTIVFGSYWSLTWPIKLSTVSSKQWSCWYCYLDVPHDAKKKDGEKAWQQLHNNAASNIEQVLEIMPHKAAAIRTPTNH